MDKQENSKKLKKNFLSKLIQKLNRHKNTGHQTKFFI
jgi:hypothetical protein